MVCHWCTRRAQQSLGGAHAALPVWRTGWLAPVVLCKACQAFCSLLVLEAQQPVSGRPAAATSRALLAQ